MASPIEDPVNNFNFRVWGRSFFFFCLLCNFNSKIQNIIDNIVPFLNIEKQKAPWRNGVSTLQFKRMCHQAEWQWRKIKLQVLQEIYKDRKKDKNKWNKPGSPFLLKSLMKISIILNCSFYCWLTCKSTIFNLIRNAVHWEMWRICHIFPS